MLIQAPELTGIVLCGQNRFSREGLRHLLASDSFAVVGEANNLLEAQSFLTSATVNVRILVHETANELTNDLAVLMTITRDYPEIAVVVLSGCASSSEMSAVIAAGAQGYLPAEISAEALQMSLQLILLGESILPLSKVQSSPGHSVEEKGCEPDKLRSPLSGREAQILKCLETGLPNKVIARDLEMAEATVKVHIKAILRKIQVENRTQAAVWSMNNREKISHLGYL
jgi:two-component system, NarL family, nitrate/nitrite response regulator NarL